MSNLWQRSIVGTAFTVQWEKVILQDKPEAGAFTFQVTLHQNGDIVFVYSVIPLMIGLIEDTAHPVKVGLSDAYIMDRIVFCEYSPGQVLTLPKYLKMIQDGTRET